MSLRSVIRMLTTIFLIATMLGGNQLSAQEAPYATPVVTEDTAGESIDITDPQPKQDSEQTGDDGEPLQTTTPATDTKTQVSAEPTDDETVATVSGIISYSDGSPAAGAEVCFTYYDGCSITDASGLYALSTISTGWHYLAVFKMSDSGTSFFEARGEVYIDSLATELNLTLTESPNFGSIDGVVTNDGGDPIAGATVCVASTRCTTSDSTGYYLLTDIPRTAKTTVITATKDGFNQSTRWTTLQDRAHTIIDFWLYPAFAGDGSIEGHVLSSWDHTPLPGLASVCIEGGECVSTDENGYYTFPTIPLGRYKLTASLPAATDGTTWLDRSLDVQVTGHNRDINFYVNPWAVASITGTVVDTSDSSPLTGVEVCAAPWSGGGDTTCVVTDSSGNFDISGHGYVYNYRISITHDGFLPYEAYPLSGDTDIQIRLWADGFSTIYGWVEDQDGQRIAGLDVCLDGQTLCTVSGSDGSYTLEGVPHGEQWITASGTSPDGTRYRSRLGVRLNVVQDYAEVTPTVQRVLNLSYSGHVVDNDGGLVSGASVCAASYSSLSNSEICTTSDSEGAFRLDNVDGLNYILASMEGMFPGYYWAEGQQSEDVEGITIVLYHNATLTGVIVDENGTLLENATICQIVGKGEETGCTNTDANGVFSITDIPANSNHDASFVIAARGCKQHHVGIRVPSISTDAGTIILNCRDAQVPEVPTSALSGLVTDEAGAPLSGTTICVSGVSTCTLTEADGSYTVTEVKHGERSVTASLTGFVTQTQKITTSDQNATLNFTMVREASPEPTVSTISGAITDEDGTPLADASICITGTTQCTTSGVDGTYALPEITHGEQSVTATLAGFVSQTQPVTVTGESVVLNFALVQESIPEPVEATLTGIVADPDNSPITGAEVCVGTICTTTGGDGMYTLMVIPGEVTVIASAEGFVFQSRTMTVAENDLLLTSFVLERVDTPQVGEHRLIVRIVLSNDGSIEGAPYTLYAAQAAIQFQTEPYRSGAVGADNIIEMSDLLPGTYKLVVSPEGMAPIEELIEVMDQPLTEVVITVDVSDAGKGDTGHGNGSNGDGDNTKTGQVTSLPSTGTGAANGSIGVMVMLGVAAASLLMAGGLAVRLKRG